MKEKVNIGPAWYSAVKLHFFCLRNCDKSKRDDVINNIEAEMLRLANAYTEASKLIASLQEKKEVDDGTV